MVIIGNHVILEYKDQEVVVELNRTTFEDIYSKLKNRIISFEIPDTRKNIEYGSIMITESFYGVEYNNVTLLFDAKSTVLKSIKVEPRVDIISDYESNDNIREFACNVCESNLNNNFASEDNEFSTIYSSADIIITSMIINNNKFFYITKKNIEHLNIKSRGFFRRSVV